MTEMLRSGAVAERVGVNMQTLRYYERRGLLARPIRSSGGHRLYDESAVATLRIIKAAQRLGFTLDEVAELLDTGRHGHPTPDLQARAVAKIAEIDQKLAALHTIREGLEQIVTARCDSLTGCTCADCPIPYADLARPEEAPR